MHPQAARHGHMGVRGSTTCPLTCKTLSPLVHAIQALQQTVDLRLDLAQLSFDGVQLFGPHCGEEELLRSHPAWSQRNMPSWAATSGASSSPEHPWGTGMGPGDSHQPSAVQAVSAGAGDSQPQCQH